MKLLLKWAKELVMLLSLYTKSGVMLFLICKLFLGRVTLFFLTRSHTHTYLQGVATFFEGTEFFVIVATRDPFRTILYCVFQNTSQTSSNCFWDALMRLLVWD